jgi:hypothetical protein
MKTMHYLFVQTLNDLVQVNSAWTHPVHGIGHLSSSMNLLALKKG